MNKLDLITVAEAETAQLNLLELFEHIKDNANFGEEDVPEDEVTGGKPLALENNND